MANRFWVGGGSSANWSAVGNTNWGTASNTQDNASVPGVGDDVFFDGVGTGAANCTLTATATCKSINFTGYANTFTHNAGITITIPGNITFVSGMTYTIGSTTSQITVSGTSSLVTGTKVMPAISISSTGALTLTEKTTISGYKIQLDAGGTFTHANQEVEFNTAGIKTVKGAFTFYKLTRTGTASTADTLNISNNITVSNTLTLAGNSSVFRLGVTAGMAGTRITITNTGATMTWSNVDFRDIGLGTAYDASAITGGSGDQGNNNNITFTTAQTPWYFKGTTNNGTANNYDWHTYNNWYTATNGGGSQMASTRVPLAQDSFTIDASSLSTTSTIRMTMERWGKDIDFSGNDDTLTLTTNVSSPQSFFGSLNLTGVTTFTNSNQIIAEGRANSSVTSNGKSFAGYRVITPSVTHTFADAFTSSGTLTVTLGTLDAGANNVTIAALVQALGSSLSAGSATWTLSGTGTPWSFSALATLNANTATIKLTNAAASNITFAGGSKTTYYNLWISRGTSTNSVTFTGNNTFAGYIKDDTGAAHSLIFTAASTQTCADFQVTGSSGNVITLNSSTTGTFALTKTGGGVISCDWLNIQHCIARPWSGASGADTWYAGGNSTDNQATVTAGNGWLFSTPPGGTTIKDLIGGGFILFPR